MPIVLQDITIHQMIQIRASSYNYGSNCIIFLPVYLASATAEDILL